MIIEKMVHLEKAMRAAERANSATESIIQNYLYLTYIQCEIYQIVKIRIPDFDFSFLDYQLQPIQTVYLQFIYLYYHYY